MQRTFLISKIHNCILTDACLDYVGSISIDQLLLEAVGIMPYEQVHVLNITNGSRLITYAIPAPSGSGRIELNGAAAHRGKKGDRLIVMAYAQLNQAELSNYAPSVALVDEHNHLQTVRRYKVAEQAAMLGIKDTASVFHSSIDE